MDLPIGSASGGGGLEPDGSPTAAPGVGWADRLAALAVVAAALTTVVVLLRVDPDARGFGTHEQLGMTACSWPDQFGIPCPTCGCTTAAAHLVHLSPLRALAVQPFGAVAAGAVLWLGAIAGSCLVRGKSFVEQIALWPYPKLFLGGVVLALGSWGYKYLTWPA